MMGTAVVKSATLVLGYIYPAYECFKSLEGRIDAEKLKFWCKYWILLAVITALEKVTDPLLSWLPLYHESKLALIVFMWHSKAEGANHLYSQFLRPYVLKYEPEIDRRIAELQNGVGTSIANYSQVGTQYIKARFLEVVQYLASQSPRNRAQVRGRHLRNNLSRRNPQQTPWELDETTEREPAFSPNRYGQVAADEDEDEDEMRDYDVVEPFSADDDLPLNEVPPSGGDDQDQDLDPVVTRRLRSRSRNGRRRN